MDSLSQIVLGAAVCGVVVRQPLRRAMLYGAALGTLPDLDVLLLGHLDPLAQFVQHRSFSHSLFVLSALSLPLAWLLRRIDRQLHAVSAKRWFMAVWLVLVTHILLDACTVYGTQLFWPLMPAPTSGSFVFIIDPLYTLPLLLACLLAWRWRTTAGARQALMLGMLAAHSYLVFGWLAKQHVEHQVASILSSRGEATEAILATPAPFTTLLWRVLVRTPKGHEEGWYSLVNSDPARFQPQVISRDSELRIAAAKLPALVTLDWFSHGYFKLEVKEDRLRAFDLRMGAEPDYFFAFEIAERRNEQWQAIVPKRVEMARPRSERLKEVYEKL